VSPMLSFIDFLRWPFNAFNASSDPLYPRGWNVDGVDVPKSAVPKYLVQVRLGSHRGSAGGFRGVSWAVWVGARVSQGQCA
jgi:hypothetical protein